jgi:hypothetical protein
MIPILNILVGIDDRLNKNSNLEQQSIPVETKITVANQMQDKLILKKLGLNNNYQLGLDAFKKRYEDLQVLVVNYEKQLVTKTPEDLFNSYSMSVTNLTNSFLMPIDLYVTSTKGKCENRILNIIDIIKHGDVQTKLNSPHFVPSFNYQESLASISSNNIYIYPDKENSFVINSLYITYLRYPIQMDYTGYIHLNGTPSTTVDCELDAYLENELLDLIVEQLAKNTANQEVVQNSIRGNSTNE